MGTSLDASLLALVTSTTAYVKGAALDILEVTWPFAIGFALVYFAYRTIRAALRGRA